MKNYSIEVRISDMAAIVLRSFKSVLCCVIIFALLGAGLGLFRSLRGTEAPFEKVTEAESRVKKSEEELAEAEAILDHRKKVEIPETNELVSRSEQLVRQKRDYLNESIYYSIDPYHCGFSHLLVRFDRLEAAVSGNDLIWQEMIDAAYASLFEEDSEALLGLRETLDTRADTQYIKEIVSLVPSSDCSVDLVVYHSDPETAEQMTESLHSALLAQLRSENARVGSRVLYRDSGVKVNWEMQESHRAAEDDLLQAERVLLEERESLSKMTIETAELEAAVSKAYDTLLEDQKDLRMAQMQYSASFVNAPNVLKRTAKYTFLMAALGLIFGCIGAVFLSVSQGKLQSQQMILSAFDFPVLGVFPREKARPFDKLIRKLEGELDTDAALAPRVIAQNLLLVAEGHSACFVSSLGRDSAGKLLPFLDGQIPVCGSILDEPDALRALSAFDSVVLVEERGVSSLDKIAAELRNLQTLGKPVLGMILI